MGGKHSSMTTEEMILLYNQNLTLDEIGARAGLLGRSILNRLDRAGVPRRGSAILIQNHVEVTEPLLEVIDGIMLGDGHLTGTNRPSSKIIVNQSANRKGWVQQLQSELAIHGIACTITHRAAEKFNRPGGNLSNRKERANLTSTSYLELKEQRVRWYDVTPRYQTGAWDKILPHDVRLTPKAIAAWFCGDGCIFGDNDSKDRIKLSTESFLEPGTKFLAKRLNEIYGFTVCLVYRGQNIHGEKMYALNLNWKADVQKFIHIVRPYIPDCCGYKLGECMPIA